MNQTIPVSRAKRSIVVLIAITLFLVPSACASGESGDVSPEFDNYIDESNNADREANDSTDESSLVVEKEEKAEKNQAYPEQDPVSASRSDRLTPTAHPPEGLERVPDLDETPVVGEVPQDIMESILEDVLDRSGADIEDVKVIRGENIIWPNGSLGCGKPGDMYTQAQVPGYWVVLEVGGETYDYRVTENGYFNICEQQLPFINPSDIGGTPEM